MARYADTLLSEGEHIVVRSRQHWLATIIDNRIPWALFVAAVVLLVLRPTSPRARPGHPRRRRPRPVHRRRWGGSPIATGPGRPRTTSSRTGGS